MPSIHSSIKLFRPYASAYHRKSARPYSTQRTGGFSGWEEPRFSSTDILVAALRSSRSLEAFELSDEAIDLVSYRVSVEADKPMLRFRVTRGSENFLSFSGKSEPGFEVLELVCAGFQYHWRSDLAKVAECRLAHLGRMFITGGASDFAVEHLAIPRFSNSRLIEISGWFCFDKVEKLGMPPRVTWDDRTIARRSRRSQPIKLPRRLCWADPWKVILTPHYWLL